jgi:nicotinate-nucleotide adenylyltransferase
VRIGLFGGTFDPPHIGHLIVAQDAAEALELDRVLFVPAGIPPHKRERAISPAQVRLAMARAAVGEDARFMVHDCEVKRAGPSYTVDTLAQLRAEHAGVQIFLLLGTDQYSELHTWHRAGEIRQFCQVAVLERGGGGPAPSASGTDTHIPVTRIDLSGSEIRARVAAGRSIRFLVTGEVEQLIRAHGLYRGASAQPMAGGEREGGA